MATHEATIYPGLDKRADIWLWEKEVGHPGGKAFSQLGRTASMPFIFKHLAVMPDCHWGMGSTIGSVIATDGAVMPAAVGVDIGCGMTAARLPLTSHDLPDDCQGLHDAIDQAVPNGRTDNGGPDDKGAWREPLPSLVTDAWFGYRRTTERLTEGNSLAYRFASLTNAHPELERANSMRHLGTLGGGNHFVELCLDQEDRIWVMLHSGSRGIGNKIARVFLKKAKDLNAKHWVELPDPDLAYLVEGASEFQQYITALMWAQDFAWVSRALMMEATIRAVWREFESLMPVPDGWVEEYISCHHNYMTRENHFGRNVWVTRKGAVRARNGDMAIIPGSMGAKSYIVRGLGSKLSFCSCSHGAGRLMSRRQAKREISVEQHIAATVGVTCRKDASVIDESPAAYKDIDAVMASQTDLVEPVHTLKQFVCVKG